MPMSTKKLEVLRLGLRDDGCVEKQPSTIEYRRADGRIDRLQAQVRPRHRKVAVMLTQGTRYRSAR